MTVKEAIQSRIDRFNKLYQNAVGHTFEEDPKWCKEQNELEYPLWKEKLDSVLEKYGFKTYDEYFNQLDYDKEETIIEEITNIYREKPNHSSLYDYEMMVINDAERTVNFINEIGGVNWWKENTPGKSYFQIKKLLNEKGYETEKGHSVNSFGAMMLFTHCLLTQPEIFQYLHGALAPLVGDEGYHDDRSDIPNFNND